MPDLQSANVFPARAGITMAAAAVTSRRPAGQPNHSGIGRGHRASPAAVSLLLLRCGIFGRRREPRDAGKTIWRSIPAPVHAGIRFLAARGLCLFLPAALASNNLAAVPTETPVISADIQPSRISLGQSARLVVRLSGADFSAQPRLPEVDGLRFQPVGRSSQIRIVDGVSSSALNFSYRVSANRPGEFEIPGIDLHADGRTIRTEHLTFYVVPFEERTIDHGITSTASGGRSSLDPAVTERAEVLADDRSDLPDVESRKPTAQPAATPGARELTNPSPPLPGYPVHVKVLGGILLSMLVALSVLLFARRRR